MGISDDNFKVTSSDPTGATIATDFFEGAHYQYVKLAVGADNTATPVDSSNPLNVVYTAESGQTYVPVSGNTAGTSAVPIEICGGASISISDVEISGGTIDTVVGTVTANINTITNGVTIGVATVGSERVSVTGDVQLRASTNNIGDVDVATVAIPTSITHGQILAPKLSNGSAQMNHYVYTSGIRITNISTSITALIGGSGVTVGNGYPLSPLDTVFLEASSGGSIYAVCAGNTGATLAYIGS
jgi:hypothetical protein